MSNRAGAIVSGKFRQAVGGRDKLSIVPQEAPQIKIAVAMGIETLRYWLAAPSVDKYRSNSLMISRGGIDAQRSS